jgi:hypothetical protein
LSVQLGEKVKYIIGEAVGAGADRYALHERIAER